MKPRRPMPQRSVPMKRSELKHGGSQLKSSGPVKARKAGRPSREEAAGRDLLAARSGGGCEVHVPGNCTGRAQVWSHRKRRSQSSKAEMWSLTNGLAGCGPCELYLTDHGSDPMVRANGWTVHPSVDPAAVPVLRRGQWVWLTDAGEAIPCDLAEIATWI